MEIGADQYIVFDCLLFLILDFPLPVIEYLASLLDLHLPSFFIIFPVLGYRCCVVDVRCDAFVVFCFCFLYVKFISSIFDSQFCYCGWVSVCLFYMAELLFCFVLFWIPFNRDCYVLHLRHRTGKPGIDGIFLLHVLQLLELLC